MVFLHTGKHWRQRCTNILIRTRSRLECRRAKVTAKDYELKALLATIFSKAKLGIESSVDVLPKLTYLIFEYFSDKKKLEFSLTLRGSFVPIVETFDQLKIIDTLKDLSEDLIPKWCLDILNHCEISLKHGFVVANINLFDGGKNRCMFSTLYPTRVKSDTENLRRKSVDEYIINPAKKGQNDDSLYSFLQSCSISRENRSTTVCPDLQSLIVHSSLVKDPNNNQLKKPSEDPLNKPKQVVERRSLQSKIKVEIFFKNFLRDRPIASEVFTFCCVDIQGVLVNTRFYTYVENKRFKGYLVENVSDLSENPPNFTNAIKFETESRATLNKYICLLFNDIFSTVKEVTVLYQLSEDNLIYRLFELKGLKGDSSETNLVNYQDLSQDKLTKTTGSDEKICQIGDVAVTRLDLKTLQKDGWLNDKIISAYLNLISDRSRRLSGILPTVFVFNSFFFLSLQRGLVKLKKYIQHKIHLYDYLFLPFNLHSCHWTLFCVNVKSRTILFYDSLYKESVPDEVNLLCKFLVDIETLYVSENFPDQKDKAILPYTYKLGECVKQLNGTDCGVFAITLAEYISRREPLNYTQDQMPCIRTQIAYEICAQKLSAPLKIIPPEGYPELPSDVDLGDIKGDFKTLTFNFKLSDTVITEYLNILKEKYCIYVHPDPTDLTKEIFVFPFRSNKKTWAVIIINKKSNVLYHYFMPSPPSPENKPLYSTLKIKTGLDLSTLTVEKLPFPEDSIDSGVYVLSVAAAIAGGRKFDDFAEKNISYLRKKILLGLYGMV